MSTLDRTFQKGRLQGISEGKLEGKLEALVRMLTRRFGAVDAALVARIRMASQPEIDRWTDRLFDAPNLAAVFAAE